jgi:hypothetical protein
MVTDRQVRRLMSLIQTEQSLQVAADKVGIHRGTSLRDARAQCCAQISRPHPATKSNLADNHHHPRPPGSRQHVVGGQTGGWGGQYGMNRFHAGSHCEDSVLTSDVFS